MLQYRHEYKYHLNLFDYILVKQRLSAVMKSDSHIGEDGKYQIRSLYFDDANDTALAEKLDGVSRREKFRIRCYNSDYDFIRLEKKAKISGLGTKISIPLTAEEVEKIINGDIDWMSRDGRDLVRELYSKMKYEGLRPKTIVDYTREPFIYEAGNVRVTLDSHVRTGNYSTEFFDADLPTAEVSDGIVIMEVKYDNFLPDVIRDIIQLRDRELGSYSKYAACRTFSYK